MTDTKRGPGRPSLYTPEVIEEICSRLSKAEPLAVICRDEHMPSPTTVRDWAKDDQTISVALARAREEGEDWLAAECLAIADTPPPMTATGGTDSGHVQWAKHRTETRLKLLACWNPKKYGPKADLNVTGNLTVQRVSFADDDHQDPKP